MKRTGLLLAAIGVAALCHCPSAAAQDYILDDGTSEGSYAFGSSSTDTGSIWLNEFTVTPGLNQITSVSILWGNPGGANQDVNGRPMQALLYDDPDGDGTPFDSNLLATTAGTIQNVGTETFITYAFSSPITVGTSNFFVGFYVPGFTPSEGVRQYFAGLNDSTGNIPSRSFLLANSDGSEPSLTDLNSTTFGDENDALNINGNWMVRASAVPEPSSWAGLLLSGGIAAGVLSARRRRARQAA